MEKQSQLKYRAYNFSVNIIKFASELPEKRIYWIISDQLVRASTSIGANIIEAQAASSRKDFTNFYHIALKSALETKYWLSLLKDTTSINDEKIKLFLKEADELAKMLRASLLTLKNKR